MSSNSYINISGNSCSINTRCSRWDISNYSIILETWLNKTQLQDLRDSITPQAIGELYVILGRPTYYDSTWSASNTITITPISGTQISLMRNEQTIYVKNISDSPVEGISGWINVKIEGLISGSNSL